MTSPSILTVILNYRTPELTLKAAAAALKDMAELNGEIVIVDNASGDDSFDVMSRAAADRAWNTQGRIKVVQSPSNAGTGAGNNFGIRTGLSDGSRPDFIYLLNSDAWPETGAIRALQDFLIAHPLTGIAGSRAHGVDGELLQTAFRFPSIYGEFKSTARTGLASRFQPGSIQSKPAPQEAQRVDWVAGTSMMIRHNMLDKIGLFDESFLLQFEEIELCHRAAQSGWHTHYVGASEIIFFGSAIDGMTTWRRVPERWFEARLQYFIKMHGPAYAGLATVSRASGCVIGRLRRITLGRPQRDPVGFLGDLITHSLRAAFRQTGASANDSAAEDLK